MKMKRTEKRYLINKWIALALTALALLFVFTACQDEKVPDVSLPANGSDVMTGAEASQATVPTLSENDTSMEASESASGSLSTVVSTQSTTLPVSTTLPATTTQAATPQHSTTASKPTIPTTTKAKPTTTARATARPVTTTRKAVTTTAKPTITAPAFDANYWVQYAKDFAVQIGIELDKGTMGTWDTPIGIGSGLKYMERDIKDRLSRYYRQGYTSVWVWAEKRANSEKFDLYISRG